MLEKQKWGNRLYLSSTEFTTPLWADDVILPGNASVPNRTRKIFLYVELYEHLVRKLPNIHSMFLYHLFTIAST